MPSSAILYHIMALILDRADFEYNKPLSPNYYGPLQRVWTYKVSGMLPRN